MSSFKKPSTKTMTQPNKTSPMNKSRTVTAPTPAARTAALAAPQSFVKAPARVSAVEAKPSYTEVSRTAIAEAAYFLWLQRGGDEISNWLEAESSLKKVATGKR